MQNRPKRTCKQRGSTLILCLCASMSAIGLATALLWLETTSSKVSYRAWQKVQADVLAESGVEEMFAQIANAYAGQSVNTSPIPPTTVNGTIGGISSTQGTYSAKVISSTSSLSGSVTVVTYRIQGTGVSPDGKTTSIKQSTFSMSTNGPVGSPLSDMAIKTNGSINISGGAYTKDPSGNHAASVAANGSIADSSSGMSIDGTASYYVNSNLTGKANSTVLLSSQMSFPDSTTTNSWHTAWLAQSQQATASHPSGNIVNGNLTFSTNGAITAPMYISGNLTVSGGHQLTISVDPSASKPCVLFVHGTVTVSGGSSLLNQGVVIVSDGVMTFSGGSNVYGVTDMVNSGLISFSTDLKNAINISGGSGAAQVGVIYAVNGGATLSGGSSYNGSLTTGGVGNTTTLSGGSSVYYLPGSNLKDGPFMPSWTASSLSKWVALK